MNGQSDRFNMIVSLLFAFGVPAAWGITLAVTQDRRQAVTIMVLYGLGVVVFGFVAKEWHRLEDPRAENTAAWLTAKLQAFFGRYRRRYRQYLLYRHHPVAIMALTSQITFSLELAKVFVDLTVYAPPADYTTKDPMPDIAKELLTDGRSLWDFLRTKPMQGQHLAIIGPPGSGKTSLLMNIALTLSAGRQPRRQVRADDLTPILLFLPDHAAQIINRENYTLGQAIQDSLDEYDIRIPMHWFAALLAKHKGLIMLDGLDEVADIKDRKQIVGWLEKQMASHRSNHFIIASRTHSYHSNPLSGVTVLKVRPFNMVQIEGFIHRWYLANETMSQQKGEREVWVSARQGKQDLLKRLRDTPALLELAVIPLHLTMISAVYSYRSSLPSRLVELYAEICELFLKEQDQSRDVELNLTPSQKQRILQFLAYEMMVQQQRKIPRQAAIKAIITPLGLIAPNIEPATFLTSIEKSSGLLLEWESEEYSFAHLTFQEYLAAAHCKEQALENVLVEQVAVSWWYETIRLYSALASAAPVIAACIAGVRPAASALTLAIECMAEAGEVDQAIWAQLETKLAEGVEDENPEQRRLIAETLLAVRLRRMRPLGQNNYVDDTLITQAEYQLFLDEERSRHNFRQPDHWLALNFPAGQGRMPVAGIRSSDAEDFCQWLTAREEGLWHYRLPRGGELTRPTAEDTSVGYWVHLENGRYAVADYTAAAGSSAHGLAGAGDFARALAHVLASDLAADLDHTLALAGDLVLALDLVLASAHDLARELDQERKSSYDLAGEFDRVLDLAGERDLASARNLVGDLNLAVDLAFAVDLASDRDLSSARNFATARDRNLSRARDLDLASKLASAGDPDLASELANINPSARARAHDLASNLALVLDRARNLASNLARDLELTYTFKYIQTRNSEELLARFSTTRPTWAQAVKFLAWDIRLGALLMIDELSKRQEALSVSFSDRLLSGKKGQEEKERLSQAIQFYRDMYVDITILDARIEGEQPAVEGIRLVKARVTDDQDLTSPATQP